MARFLPGNTPWNKGRPHPAARLPQVRKNQFKRGGVPPRCREPGEERIDSKSGEVHIRLDRPVRVRNHKREGRKRAERNAHYWIPRRRFVWTLHHGPIPDRCIVIRLRPEDPTDDRPECLELIPRSAHGPICRGVRLRTLPDDLEIRRTAVRTMVLRHTGRAMLRERGRK